MCWPTAPAMCFGRRSWTSRPNWPTKKSVWPTSKNSRPARLAALKAANDRAGRLAATQPSNQPLPHDVAQQVIELEAKLSNTESLVDAAKREIDRQKKLADECAEQQKAQDELAAARQAAARDFAQAQAVYLTAAAPTDRAQGPPGGVQAVADDPADHGMRKREHRRSRRRRWIGWRSSSRSWR